MTLLGTTFGTRHINAHTGERMLNIHASSHRSKPPISYPMKYTMRLCIQQTKRCLWHSFFRHAVCVARLLSQHLSSKASHSVKLLSTVILFNKTPLEACSTALRYTCQDQRLSITVDPIIQSDQNSISMICSSHILINFATNASR